MIPCQRHLFDIPDDVAYLNCAYMSPLMKPALEAGTVGLARKAHPWELTPDQFFTGADECRAKFAGQKRPEHYRARGAVPVQLLSLAATRRGNRRFAENRRLARRQ